MRTDTKLIHVRKPLLHVGCFSRHLIGIQAVVVLMRAWGGGLEGMAGKSGLLLMVVSAVRAARDYRGCEKSAAVAEEALVCLAITQICPVMTR